MGCPLSILGFFGLESYSKFCKIAVIWFLKVGILCWITFQIIWLLTPKYSWMSKLRKALIFCHSICGAFCIKSSDKRETASPTISSCRIQADLSMECVSKSIKFLVSSYSYFILLTTGLAYIFKKPSLAIWFLLSIRISSLRSKSILSFSE